MRLPVLSERQCRTVSWSIRACLYVFFCAFGLSGTARAQKGLVAWGDNFYKQCNIPAGPFKAVASGKYHSVGLRPNGTLATWGSDSNRQVSNTPAGTFTCVAAGQSYCMALRSNGTIAAWGDNTYGQCNVPAGTYTAIAAGADHCLAIRADGTLAAWGWNDWGQCNVPSGAFVAVAGGGVFSVGIRADGTLAAWGENSQNQCNVPAGVFKAISAGGDYAVGLRPDGTLVAWGYNYLGECNVPSGVFKAVSAGNDHAVALRPDGSAVCWGPSTLGEGTPVPGTYQSIAAGDHFVIAVRAQTALGSWGRNDDGLVSNPPQGLFDVAPTGWYNTVGLRPDNTLLAWGDNSSGQCNVPAGSHVAVATGEEFDVAINPDGTLVAWGDNSSGQCNVPAGAFKAVSSGELHTLALGCDGTIVAWGDNSSGQCNVPAEADFKAVSAGWNHSLALRANGSLVAWGDNSQKQCNVPSGTFKAIAAGSNHSIALRTDGTVVAWGTNHFNQLYVPAGLFVSIAAGSNHSIALRSDGTVAAWGWNYFGQCNVPSGTFSAIGAGVFHCTVLAPDMLAPVTSAAFSPALSAAGWANANAIVTLTSVDPGDNSGARSGVASVTYSLDRGAPISVTGASTTLLPITTEGMHTVSGFGVDNVGNSAAAKTFLFGIDKSAPITALTTANLPGALQITLMAKDGLSGVANTSYSIDGGTTKTYSAPFPVTAGSRTVAFWSTDKAANREAANTQSFVISPLPTLTALNPTSAPAGSADISLVVTGTNFTNASAVMWNSKPIPISALISPTEIHASVPASLLTTLGTASITVVNPAPGGGTTAARTFTVRNPALKYLFVAPPSVLGGQSVVGSVFLDAPALADVSVDLSSSNTQVAGVPTRVVIPKGALSATFAITTVPVSTRLSVNIAGKLDGVTQTGTLAVRPAGVLNLAFDPPSVKGGNQVICTVTLQGVAGPDGITLPVSSSTPGVAAPTVLNLTIPKGATTGSFVIKTYAVATPTTVNFIVGTVSQNLIVK